MNKRIVLFLVVMTGVLWAQVALQWWLAPPPAAVQPDAVADLEGDDPAAVPGEAAIVADGPAPSEDPLAPAPERPAAEQPAADPPAIVEAPAGQAPMEPQWVVLGSGDPDGEYSMYVVLTSRGAAVHSATFNEEQFLDLEQRYDRRGSLGALVLSPREDGVYVDLVPHGSASYRFGLRAGDRLDDAVIDGRAFPIETPGDWSAATLRMRPGVDVTLTVVRDGQRTAISGKAEPAPLQVVSPEGSDPLSMLLTLNELEKRSIPKDLGARLLDTEGSGARVASVVPGGPAANARLESGDVITSVDNVAVASVGDLINLLRDQIPSGSLLRVAYLRQGIEQNTLLRLPAEIPGVDLAGGVWEVVSPKNFDPDQVYSSAEFQRRLPNGLVFVKRYTLVPNEGDGATPTVRNYHLELDLQIHNLGRQPIELAYQLDGPNGLPVEGWWYTSKIGRGFSGVGIRDVAYRTNTIDAQLIGATTIAAHQAQSFTELPPGSPFDPLQYIAVDSRYFAGALLPLRTAEELASTDLTDLNAGPRFASIQPIRAGVLPHDSKRLKLANNSFRIVSRSYTLPPQEDLDAGGIRHPYRLFLGPKQPELLARPEYKLEDLVYYGWFYYVADRMLGVLHFFYGIVGNYALAIIMLTVVVRCLVLPLSYKQTMMAQKMQELQPEIRRINEKYKGDYEGRTKATQQLFREHNYNPLAGCLPMFVQLPIFIGLYRALMVDVELRQQPLIPGLYWASNLAAPDMLFRWDGFMPAFLASETGYLGPYFNLLPVITVALFLVQQKMFMPPATDEQTIMQQKMMKWMMLFFLVMFFTVPAGLCLYFITSSCWGIAERKVMPKFVAWRKKNAPPPTAKPASGPSLLERLTERLAAAQREGNAAGFEGGSRSNGKGNGKGAGGKGSDGKGSGGKSRSKGRK